MIRDDCISRRDAIDAMKDMYRAAEKWLRDATDDVTKARAESCMANLIEIKLRTEKLPAVQPEPKWILCSKELPKEEEQSYLVCLENGYQSQCKWKRYEGKDGYIYQWHSVSKVVAWMPLPKPIGGDME